MKRTRVVGGGMRLGRRMAEEVEETNDGREGGVGQCRG